MEPVYTAQARSTGDARNGQIDSSDGQLSHQVAFPPEMGGSGQGTNPEQLFAAGYAPGLDQATADRLAEAAHQLCPYSKATRGNIPVQVTAVV